MIPTTTVEKIDVHRNKTAYRRALEELKCNMSISVHNKQSILRFLHDCEIGKTVLNRQKKRIQEKRLLKYAYVLPRISSWCGELTFQDITEVEMEKFIANLEANRLFCPRTGNEIRYSEWTKHDIKICLKKFYKWLLGDNRQYPDLVAWIDTSIADTAPTSLSHAEIGRCAEFATTVKGKALVWTLFQTGARIEEFLNIRVEHAQDRGSWFVVRIEFPKTFRRSLPVHEGADFLRQWLDSHPQRSYPQAQLFPLGYEAARKFLQRLGERALGKRVTPQLVRDSFATWLATKKVGRYQMCKLMGWAMSSNMPDRYIDRVGVVEEAAIQSIRNDDLMRAEGENRELRGALERLQRQYSEIEDRIAARAQMDEFLTKLFKEKSVEKTVMDALGKNGMGERLLRLGDSRGKSFH